MPEKGDRVVLIGSNPRRTGTVERTYTRQSHYTRGPVSMCRVKWDDGTFSGVPSYDLDPAGLRGEDALLDPTTTAYLAGIPAGEPF